MLYCRVWEFYSLSVYGNSTVCRCMGVLQSVGVWEFYSLSGMGVLQSVGVWEFYSLSYGSSTVGSVWEFYSLSVYGSSTVCRCMGVLQSVGVWEFHSLSVYGSSTVCRLQTCKCNSIRHVFERRISFSNTRDQFTNYTGRPVENNLIFS
jgi:hypothetical protein